MSFQCVDSVGHGVVLARMRAEARIESDEAESVFLRIPIEAASIDTFVANLKSMGTAPGTKACIQMAEH